MGQVLFQMFGIHYYDSCPYRDYILEEVGEQAINIIKYKYCQKILNPTRNKRISQQDEEDQRKGCK